MADYYAILGVSKTADDIEIKAAFRKLAKIYHPDKNPNNPDAKHLFENILKAYNILIHPSSRRRYDLRGSEYIQPVKTQHAKRKTQKEWTFTEEEQQRRQYYEKHYKAKQQERAKHQTPPPKAHNDYKYILFATPIAVALLMLVISMFTDTPKTVPLSKTPAPPISTQTPIVQETGSTQRLANGETPYGAYFGSIKTFVTNNSVQINNSSSYDAVIILFDNETQAYLQHAYVQSSYMVEFSKLPDNGVYWKCMLGKYWDQNKQLMNEGVSGGFDSIVQYQNWKTTPTIFSKDTESADLELMDVIEKDSKAKTHISKEADFFEK